MMMQVIAVHALGTMPQAMEFDLSKLDFIQKKALSRLPRSPQGVPELRALVKADGPVAFKFKVPPDKLAWESLPELLTLWEEKYTEAMCKVVAKEGKAERAEIAAAAMWKEQCEGGDGSQLPGAENSELVTHFSKPKAERKGGRIGKAKLPPSVLAAATSTNEVTGEVTNKLSASDKAVAALSVKVLVDKGVATPPRDTRRLSAMMMREEVRETVRRAGRSQPIKLNASGRHELQTDDVVAATKKRLIRSKNASRPRKPPCPKAWACAELKAHSAD